MSDSNDKLYPNLRRVITGHDKDGQSVVMIDDLANFRGAGTDGWRFQDIWSHEVIPPSIGATEEDPTTKPLDPAIVEDGVFIRITDLPPTPPGTKAFMHRTNSVDYIHILEGEITMLLSDGIEPVILRKGDTLVQRATDHAWVNHTDKHCRMYIVMMAGRATPELAELIGEMPSLAPLKGARPS